MSLFYQYLHFLCQLVISNSEIYSFQSQYHQTWKPPHSSFTLYITKKRSFEMLFFFYGNSFSSVLLVFLWLLHTYFCIQFFCIFIFCLLFLPKNFYTDFVLASAIVISIRTFLFYFSGR